MDALIHASSSWSAGSGLSVVPMSIAQLAPVLANDAVGTMADGDVGSARSQAAVNSAAAPATAISRARFILVSPRSTDCSVAWDGEHARKTQTHDTSS
jgi:hypothetical protein